MSATSSIENSSLNAEADLLKRRWTAQLKKAGASDPENTKDSPQLRTRLTLSGNAWSDCNEVGELRMACIKQTTGLKQESAICQAAERFFAQCLERDEFCQDPTEH
eukprot:103630_1